MDETSLSKRVREAIQVGALPSRLPDQLLGGAPTGGNCVFCGDSTEGGVEMELVFGDGMVSEPRTYYAHPRCLWIFEREVKDLPGQRRGVPDQSANAAD